MTDNRISELEERTIEFTQSEQQRGYRLGKNYPQEPEGYLYQSPRSKK